MSHVHVIPVDPTQTAIEAWDELCLFGERVTDNGWGEYWAVIEGCDGEVCHRIKEGLHADD